MPKQNSNQTVLSPTPHPLKTLIRKRHIRLWQLNAMLGGNPSESYLSRTLAGIVPMDTDLERRISSALDNLEGGE